MTDPASIKLVLLATLQRIAAALAVFLLFWFVLKVTQPALRHMLARGHFAPALIKLLVDGLPRATVPGLVSQWPQVGIALTSACPWLVSALLASQSGSLPKKPSRT